MSKIFGGASAKSADVISLGSRKNVNTSNVQEKDTSNVGKLLTNILGGPITKKSAEMLALEMDLETFAQEHGGEYDREDNVITFESEQEITVSARDGDETMFREVLLAITGSLDENQKAKYQATQETYQPTFIVAGDLENSIAAALASLKRKLR